MDPKPIADFVTDWRLLARDLNRRSLSNSRAISTGIPGCFANNSMESWRSRGGSRLLPLKFKNFCALPTRQSSVTGARAGTGNMARPVPLEGALSGPQPHGSH